MKSYDARTLSEKDRTEVLERDNYKCQYCGGTAEAVDHIIPWSHSHSNAIFNLVSSCQICNSVASNKVFDTFMEKKNHIITRRLQMLSRRAVPIWTKEEIKGLRGRIREMVMTSCVVVEDRAEGLVIANRLAKDGFSVTFGEGEEVSVETILAEIKTTDTEPLKPDGTTKACAYCERIFYGNIKERGFRQRRYCSNSCAQKSAHQRFWKNKLKGETK